MLSGHQAIRVIVAGLFHESRIDVLASSLESAGDLGVGTERWRIRPLGSVWEAPRRLEATVVQRRVGGAWRLVLAALCGE
jgi:hypothetical protein